MNSLYFINIIKSGIPIRLRNFSATIMNKSSAVAADATMVDYEEEKIIELTKLLVTEMDFQSDISKCKHLANEYRKNKPVRAPTFKRYVYVQVSALAILAISAFVYMENVASVYETKIGEQRTIVLEDSSKISLNTNTKIRVKYSQKLRTIWMEKGEAYFAVSHDAKRPFLVNARNGTVRAVGTAFNVGIRDDVISVAVLEGSVNVVATNELSASLPSEGQAKLKVGESVKYWSNGMMGNIEVAEDTRINAWREGKLRFKDVNLVDAIEEHNRYTTRKIVIGSDKLRFLSVNGVFKIGDTNSLLFLLEASLGLEVVRRPDVIVLLPKNQTVVASGA